MAHRKKPGMTASLMTQLPSSTQIAHKSRHTSILGRRASGILDESKITSKGQMTLPKIVRTALGVDVGDRVQFVARDSSIVLESAQQEPDTDPDVAAFLDLVEDSIDTATAFPMDLMIAMKSLVADIEVDLDAPIEGDVVI